MPKIMNFTRKKAGVSLAFLMICGMASLGAMQAGAIEGDNYINNEEYYQEQSERYAEELEDDSEYDYEGEDYVPIDSYSYSRRRGMDYYDDLEALFAVLGTIMLFVFGTMIFAFAVMCKIFAKTGREWWKALIPIYNSYELVRIAGLPEMSFLLFFVPMVNVVFGLYVLHKLSLAFGKDIAFTIGLAVLPIVFLPILAFSKDIKYQLGRSSEATSGAVSGAASGAGASKVSEAKKKEDPWVAGEI